QLFIKVTFEGSLHTVIATTQIDLVQIEIKDLFFGELLFNLSGEKEVFDFPGDGALFCQEEGFRHLLSDGGAALNQSSFFKVYNEGTHDAVVIDAFVIIEVIVLGGEEGVYHSFGNILKFHHVTGFNSDVQK